MIEDHFCCFCYQKGQKENTKNIYQYTAVFVFVDLIGSILMINY
jgi:hypothetical protein